MTDADAPDTPDYSEIVDPGSPLDVPPPDPIIARYDELVRAHGRDGDDKRYFIRDGDLTQQIAELTEIAYDMGWGRWNQNGSLHDEDWAALAAAAKAYRQRITVELMNEMFGP